MVARWSRRAARDALTVVKSPAPKKRRSPSWAWVRVRRASMVCWDRCLVMGDCSTRSAMFWHLMVARPLAP